MHITFKFLLLSFLSTVLLFSCRIPKKISNSNDVINHCSCNNTHKEFINSYYLANKKELIVCATKIQKYAHTTYKSITLISCSNSDSIVLKENKEYSIEYSKDTLIMIPEYYLPQTNNYIYLPTKIFIEKVFLNTSNQIVTKIEFNPNFPVYNQSQILDIFETYQLSYDTNEDKIIILMDKLLMAALSSNQLAMKTFKNFEAKYKNLSPELKERYNNHKEILMQYLLIASLK